MFRGALSLGAIFLALLVGDLIQRTLIAGSVSILPGSRTRILTVWQDLVARIVLGLIRAGGARFGKLPRIPGEEGTLVLMNHQSLLDIPLVVASVRKRFPWIVTRARYAKGAPFISKMVRMYQYPTVGTRATLEEDLTRIKGAAEDSAYPIVIYPEGHRTRDGEIGPFKRAGLNALLSSRRWQVYLIVADGFWECNRLEDFVATISSIRGSLRSMGPFQSPETEEDFGPFIDDMRDRMVGILEEMREEAETG